MITIKAITSYIENNYLTIEQLATASNLSVAQLKVLINNACIPKHSHMITRQCVFHTDIFGDTSFTQHIYYYHPSLIKLTIKANKYLASTSFVDVASKMKADFTQEVQHVLTQIDEAKQIFHYCFDDNGNLLTNEIEKLMIEHWPYIMDGTYGVCLKEISAKNMLLKKISVSILEEWVNQTTDNKKLLHEKTKYAAEIYDRVAGYFGPHEIIKSTRGRLFNKFKEYC